MTYLIVSDDPISNEAAALEFAKSYNPSDVFWIKKAPDKKEITVDVINNMIEQTNLMSVSGKKLFIVFQAELMNAVAQNKLLKTLESTNDDTTVLFLCKNLTNILPTIKSRSIVRYHHSAENLTLKKLAAENPATEQIYHAAQQLLQAKRVDDTINFLPVIAKPENLPLSMDALNQALKTAPFTPDKKLKIYQALATINRNVEANCNCTNAFDLLLLAMF